MSTQEEGSRFGGAQLDAGAAQPGDVVWRDGTEPALVVSINKADDRDDVAVTVAPLTVETVHADDLASEYVDPSGETPMAAPPVPVMATQAPADDPSRQTTPTGAEAGTGTATASPGAAVPGGGSAVNANEAAQDARIAELEQRLADETARAEAAEARATTVPMEETPAPVPPPEPSP